MDCPSSTNLQRFAAGLLSPAEQRDVGAHLERCTPCANQLKQVLSENEFLDQARPALRESLPEDTVAVTKRSGGRVFAQQYPHIEGYQIIQVVGQGGMGIVYEATQSKLRRQVALKVLPAILGGAHSDAVARFRREATAAAKLHHTNIIPVYDYGESRDGYYYAMELVDGEPLDTIIRRLASVDITEASPVRIAEILLSKPRDEVDAECNTVAVSSPKPAEQPEKNDDSQTSRSTSMTRRGRVYYQHVARWIADVAGALEYSHKEGIIHRDMKPSNLILSRDGRLMVADFGLAMLPDEKAITVTGSLLGTVRYMSPEQAMAKRLHVDHRTDIWSLGATLYELLAFEPAFPGMDQKEVLAKIITIEPRPPRKLSPSVPRDLETICLKCLEKSTAARYATAGELEADLRRYSEDLPIVAQPPGPFTKIARLVRRNRAKSVAVLGAILILVIGSVAMSYRNTRRVERIDHLFEATTNAVADQRWDAAETAIDELLELEPDNGRAIFVKAWSRQRESNQADASRADELLGEADALCRQARILAPDDAWGVNIHGIVLKKLGRSSDAIEAYEQSRRINPDFYAVWVNLATLYALKHDMQRCEKYLVTATKLATKNEDSLEEQKPHAVQAWRNLASVQLHLGKEEAMQSIKAAIAWNRDDVASYLIRAKIHLLLEGFIDPATALDKAKIAENRSDSPDAKIMRIRALAHLNMGQFDKAIKHANDALEHDDLAAFDHLIIAIAAGRRGDSVLARNHLAKAEDAWPQELIDAPFAVSAPAGVLWFDSAEQLAALRVEAREAIGH